MSTTTNDRLSQRAGIRGLCNSWEQFWFSPSDPTTLSLMRLLGGFLILYAHLAYSFDLQAFFGKDAWLDLPTANIFRHEIPQFAQSTQWEKPGEFDPRTKEEIAYYTKWGHVPKEVADRGRPVFSLWFHITDPIHMRIVHTVVLACMFLFAIGFCTRATGALTWVFSLCYINRSNVSLFGMDSMLSMTALYLIVGPSGAHYSVDRLVDRWIAAKRQLAASMPAPSVSATVAIRLFQIHLCLIYWISGLSKLQGGSWWNGTATWGTMVNYEMSPMRNSLYMGVIRALASKRWIWEVFITTSTSFSLLLELTMPLAIWNRNLRWLYISLCSVFHLTIALCMGLTGFGAAMLVLLLSFVPGPVIRSFQIPIFIRFHLILV